MEENHIEENRENELIIEQSKQVDDNFMINQQQTVQNNVDGQKQLNDKNQQINELPINYSETPKFIDIKQNNNFTHDKSPSQEINNNHSILIDRKQKKSFTTIKNKPHTEDQERNMTNYLLPRIIVAPRSQSSQKQNSYLHNNNPQNIIPSSGHGLLRSKSNFSLHSCNTSVDKIKTNQSSFAKQKSINNRGDHHHKTMVENYSFMNGKKVYMSVQDMAKLKRLKLQYQRRQQKIHQKIQQHQQQLERVKLLSKKEKQQKQQKQRQQRVMLVKQRQHQRSVKRLRTLSQHKQQNKLLKQIKSKQKLYEKMENSFVLKQKQQKEMRQSRVKEQIQKKKIRVDYDQIKQSARHYKKSRSLRIQQSRQKLRSSLQNLKQQFENMNVYRSRFYSQAKEQKKKMKQSRLITEHKPIQYKQRIQQYEHKVKQKHLPKSTKNKLKLQLNNNNNKQRRVYGQKEIREIGNRNMRLVLNNVVKAKIEKQNFSKKNNYNSNNKDENKSNNKDENKSNNKDENKSNNKDENKSNNKDENKSNNSLLVQTVDRQLSGISASKHPEQRYQKLKSLQQHLSKQFSRKQSLKLSSKQYVDKEIQQIGVKLRVMEGLVASQ